MIRTAEQLIELIEENNHKMPKSYRDLIMSIDIYIFGAQQGFDLATELFMARKLEDVEATKAYKRAYAKAIYDAEIAEVKVSGREKWAESRCIDQECFKIDTDAQVIIAKYWRDIYLERLNTFKKIKGDNINMRGTG